jgi:hypothetical protein
MAEMRSNALMQRSGRTHSTPAAAAESDAPYSRVRTRFNAGDLPEWRTDSMFEVSGLLKADILQQQLTAQLQQLPPATRQQEAAAVQAAAAAVAAEQQARARAAHTSAALGLTTLAGTAVTTAAGAATANSAGKQRKSGHAYERRRAEEAQQLADVQAARLTLAPSRAGQAVRTVLKAAGAVVHDALLPRVPVQPIDQRSRGPARFNGRLPPTPPLTPLTPGEEQLCIAGLQRYGVYHWDVLQRALLPHRTVAELQSWLRWQEWLWTATAGQSEMYRGPCRCARDYLEQRRSRTAFSSVEVIASAHVHYQ